MTLGPNVIEFVSFSFFYFLFQINFKVMFLKEESNHLTFLRQDSN
jgi:hypothetical protein